jgi:hypothetical protein
MHPYHAFVTQSAQLIREARALPHGGFAPAPRPQPSPEAGCALIFAPHPDDECLTGGLALRLLRQARMRVVDVAVTLGSNPARQQARLEELRGACAFLGFELQIAGELATLADLIAREQPRLIIFPHAGDAHRTHAQTHMLVMGALARQAESFGCYLALSEYWAALAAPNLMVESSLDEVADLVAATSFHAGEVARHGYHLGLPSWMHDNVRRGSELIGGAGAAAVAFEHATLYRLERWQGHTCQPAWVGGRQLGSHDHPDMLFAG